MVLKIILLFVVSCILAYIIVDFACYRAMARFTKDFLGKASQVLSIAANQKKEEQKDDTENS